MTADRYTCSRCGNANGLWELRQMVRREAPDGHGSALYCPACEMRYQTWSRQSLAEMGTDDFLAAYELDQVELGIRAAHDLTLEGAGGRFYLEWLLRWGSRMHPARPALNQYR